MLAYVFWHWPALDVARSDYEAHLIAFHDTLGRNAPDGFLQSESARVSGAPWLPEGEGYEDRYLVSDFGALGELNRAAPSGPRELAHHAVAALSEGGAGAVYALRAGNPNPVACARALWFSKPPATRYAELDDLLRPATEIPGVALWQRQLALGPASEFCLLPVGEVPLPGSITPVEVVLSSLWPRS